MSVPISAWRDVIAAARASERADCGHRVNHLFFLRTEHIIRHTEVWSVCMRCREAGDYTVSGDRRPYRDIRQLI